MTESPYGPPPAPADAEPRRGWSGKHTVVAAAVAVAVAVGGGVALAAADERSATAQGPGGPGFPVGRMGAAGGLTGALHGEFVVSDGNGGTATRLLQTGAVTAVDAASITVRSTDGYSATYSVGSSTTVNGGRSGISAVETGHAVTVVASSAKAALTILDQDLAGGGMLPPDGTGQQPGQQPPGTGRQPGTGTTTGTTT